MLHMACACNEIISFYFRNKFVSRRIKEGRMRRPVGGESGKISRKKMNFEQRILEAGKSNQADTWAKTVLGTGAAEVRGLREKGPDV